MSPGGAAPFFLYLGLTVPHAGGCDEGGAEDGQPVPSDLQYAETGADWPEVERDHAASITYLDARLGAVLAKLRDLQAEDDTLVLFVSDNGVWGTLPSPTGEAVTCELT